MNIIKWINIDINLIKTFYKTVLPLECFKSIYLELYGKDEYYPFQDQKFTDDFVDKNFEFIPMNIYSSLGLSDKFTLKTYFFSFLPKIKRINNYFEKTAIKIGSLLKAMNHEIGYNFININFFMRNCQISRKKYFEFEEGGSFIELALYGTDLEEITLEQALFILNEKNYKKSFLKFQERFNKMKVDDLKVEGVFKSLINEIDIDEKFNNNQFSKNIFKKQKKFNEKKISFKMRNDIIGKVTSDESYEKILEKYS